MTNSSTITTVKQDSKIHATAIIAKGAKIGSNVEIGPYSVIGENVEIKEHTYIGPHVILEGKTEIGANCKLIAACSIGFPPQDINYKDELTGVKIGDGTTIREYVTIHRAAKAGYTEVGKNCFLMNYVHIGHNVVVGNNVIMANSAILAGYVTVGDYTFISGLSAIHQHCRIGESVMFGGMTGSRLDVPHYFIADGRPAKLRGVNKVGLRRRGVKRDVINEIEKAFKILYQESSNTTKALERIATELVQHDEIKKIVEFYKTTKRGVVATGNISAGSDIELTL